MSVYMSFFFFFNFLLEIEFLISFLTFLWVSIREIPNLFSVLIHYAHFLLAWSFSQLLCVNERY
jgi:hypothetical protein